MRACSGRPILGHGLTLGVVLWCAPSQAQATPEPAGAPDEDPPICGPVIREGGTTRVDFRAGVVEVDGDLTTLELRDDVEICVARYRLRSERLRLTRGPRGVETEGPGQVSFCPCADPPVRLGFSSALLAPPTDLLVEDPTLYVGNVPVMYLPALWLRSSDRLGLLPPVVQWRGDDGLFAGAGVHVPLGNGVAADLRAGGYFEGGADIDAALSSNTTSTRVSWDRLEESVTEVEATGYADAAPAGGVTWRADVARGTRARRGIMALSPAAQRFDRVEFEAQGAEGGLALGVGFSGSARRGQPHDAQWLHGPGAFAALHGAIGSVGSTFVDARARTFSGPVETTTVVVQRSRVALASPLGPVAASVRLGQGALSQQREREAQRAAWLSARSSLGLPLERRFGAEGDWQHRIEPEVVGWVRQASLSGSGALPIEERNLAGLVGLKSRVGAWRTGSGLSAAVRGGRIAATRSGETWGGLHLLADFGMLGASVDAASGLEPEEHSAVFGQLRIGSLRSWSVSGHVEGTQDGGADARYIARDEIEQLPFARLAGPGWSAGGGTTLAWARFLSTAATTHFDVSDRSLVALAGATSYRHPCDCLALVAQGAHRVGRGGVDVMFSVDLMP